MKERKPNETLLEEDKLFLQVLVKKHCKSYDSIELNEYGEIEIITGTTWKWLAKLIGKVERIPFMDICWDIAESIADNNKELLSQIQQYIYAYVIGGSKSELISRLLVAELIGVINTNSSANGNTVQIELPNGLFMVDVSSEYIQKDGNIFQHPNMLEFLKTARRR